MASWREAITSIAGTAENIDDYYGILKYRMRERMGGRNPVMITTYRGLGTQQKLYLKGRVLEDKGVNPAADDDSVWDNLVNMYKRFTSAEIPHARIRARFQDAEREFVADHEGYFDIWLEPTQPLPTDRLWHDIELELVWPLRQGAAPVHAVGSVLVPPDGCQYAVISDIDDTVLYTDAVHLLSMARTVFLGNARTRLPFKGVAAFYRALFRGHDQRGINPLFYISNSPWNLYDLLSDFFHLNDIPVGPILFLRSWGLTRVDQLPTRKRHHKLSTARRMLSLFPHLPFILVGDSGEKDPEIYAQLVNDYPRRIQAVYIRNVSRNLERPAEIRALAKKVLEAGSTLIMADDTWPLAQHAAAQGWISPDALAEIDAERQKDAAPASPLEQLLGEPEQSEVPTVVVSPHPAPGTSKANDVAPIVINDALQVGEDRTSKPRRRRKTKDERRRAGDGGGVERLENGD
jgi:phosphatidate phosphatase APP1